MRQGQVSGVLPKRKISENPQRAAAGKVVRFDLEELKAPVYLRCGAILIDYILIIVIPVVSLLIGRIFGNTGTELINGLYMDIGVFSGLIIGLLNFLVFPFFGGQTIGKMIAGLRISELSGGLPGFRGIVIRHLFGYSLTFLTGGLGFFLSFFTNGGRALHDYLGGTVVIYGEKKLVRK